MINVWNQFRLHQMINLSFKRAYVWKRSSTWSCCIPLRFEPLSSSRSWTWPFPMLYLESTSTVHTTFSLLPSITRIRPWFDSQSIQATKQTQGNSDCEVFSEHYYLGAEARAMVTTARSLSENKTSRFCSHFPIIPNHLVGQKCTY